MKSNILFAVVLAALLFSSNAFADDNPEPGLRLPTIFSSDMVIPSGEAFSIT